MPGAPPTPSRPPVTVSKLERPPGAASSSGRRVEAQRLPRQELSPAEAAAAAATGRQEQRPGQPPGQPPAAAGPVTPVRQDQVTGVEKGGGQEERDWVRQLLEGLWPNIRSAAEAAAWEIVPPQLEASRPAFVYSLELERFTLGDSRPAIRDIRVHGGGGAGIEELFVEFEVEWKSEQDLTLHITVPHLPVAVAEVTPDAVEEAMRLVLQLTVSLKHAWVRAGVRVTLAPLLHRLPVLGAIQVGLTRLPQFGYDLNLSIGAAALTPLIKAWLDEAVRDLVLQPWVLPEHYFLPIDQGVRDVERPAGVLAVRVLDAQDMPSPGLLSSARPMLEVFVRDSQRRQTHVAELQGGSRACWDARFEFPVSVPEHQELTIILYSFSDWSPNDELGRAQLALRDLAQAGRPLPAAKGAAAHAVAGGSAKPVSAASAGGGSLQRGVVEREVVLEIRSKEEDVHDRQQQRAGLASRAALALGRPFTKRGGSRVCKLRLQLSYIGLTEGETRLIMEQQRMAVPARAARAVAAASHATGPAADGLTAAGASGQQARLHPLAQRLLLSGLLVVEVPRAEGLPTGQLFRPYFKAVVTVRAWASGDSWRAETDAARASRQGVAEFSRPVSLHLPEEAVRDEGAQVEIELLEHGWVGGATSCGTAELGLRELVAGGHITGPRRLVAPGSERSTQVQLEASFRPYF